jgi:hypothetical protein
MGQCTCSESSPRFAPTTGLGCTRPGHQAAWGQAGSSPSEKVVSDPQRSQHKRWAWKVKLRDIIAGPDLPHCPTISEIDVKATSLRSHTHIKLGFQAGMLAETLLERASQRPR